MTDYTEGQAALLKELERLGVTFEAHFVPLRFVLEGMEDGEGRRWRSYNWLALFTRQGKTLRTPYAQGVGLAPGYPQGGDRVPLIRRQTDEAVETGRIPKKWGAESNLGLTRPLPPPAAVDVLGSLLLDARGIEGVTFEDWCRDYDYSTDSRKALRLYERCQRIEVQLREMFSRGELTRLYDLADAAGVM